MNENEFEDLIELLYWKFKYKVSIKKIAERDAFKQTIRGCKEIKHKLIHNKEG